MKKNLKLDEIGIEKLVKNNETFANFIYTPLPNAIREVMERRKNKQLERKINDYLSNDIPGPLVQGLKAVLFRQLFTPNYELRLFMQIIKNYDLHPLFFEYHDDKFASVNPLKRSLGKLKFRSSFESNNRIECKNIIEFNASDGRKIKEIKTIKNDSLISFHHRLLASTFPNSDNFLFDASMWFHSIGRGAKDYYSKYLSLFIRNGILFENFTLFGPELIFVKNVFLPSFFEIWDKIGVKPIITSLLPLQTQDHEFWIAHPFDDLNYITQNNLI